MPKRILVFAREAGGAAVVAPVYKALLSKGWESLLLAKDHSLNIFRKHKFSHIDFPCFDIGILESLISKKFKSLPDIIFTSAASLPTLDMTEKYLWSWGQAHGIPTVGIVDQWQNYALRFSGPRKDERLRYIPDYIFTMDILSKKDMIKENIPKKNIIITGQPAFDRIKEEQKELLSQKNKIRNRLHIPHNSKIITFVGESLRKDFGFTLGYDEHSILKFLCGALNKLCEENKNLNIHLIIKPHPENMPGDFIRDIPKKTYFTKQIIGNSITGGEVIAISDIITGMTSVMLIESIITGKPTVSLQINSLVGSQLAATKAGAVPFIKNKAKARQVLRSLLYDRAYKRGYLDRQKRWKVYTGEAVKNCVKTIESIIGR